MLPEVNAYLSDIFHARGESSPAQSYVYFFALATPIALAMLAYIMRGILNLTIWYDPKRRQPYMDPFFYIAVIILVAAIIVGFSTFIGEVRQDLSERGILTQFWKAKMGANLGEGAVIPPVPENIKNYKAPMSDCGMWSIILFVVGAVSLFFMERREKFLGALPFYTICIFLFVTPIFYNVQFEREGLLPKEAAGCILGLQLICFFGLHWALNRKFIPVKSMIILPLGLLMAWCIIGFFIFPHQLAAIKNLKQLVTFAAIFYSIVFFVKSEKYLRVLIWVTIIAANISVAWGLMRFFDFNIFGLPESYFQEPKAGKSFLLSGFFANPNYFSEYLAVIIFMCIGLGVFTKNIAAKAVLFTIAGVDVFHLMMTYTRAAWVGIGIGAIAAELMFLIYILRKRPFASRDPATIDTRKMLANVLAVIIALRTMVLLLAFYLMFSKGLYKVPVYLAQLIGLAILAVEVRVYIQGTKNLKTEEASAKPGTIGSYISPPIVSAGVTIIALMLIFSTFIGVTKNLAAKTQSYPHVIAPSERVASLADFKGDETFRNRLNMWCVGLEMFKDRPIFGGGLGSYEIEYLEYQDKIFDRYDFAEWFHNIIPTFRAHNDHIQTISELGLVGFGLWVWFWIAVFITAWRGFVHALNFGERFLILAIFASMVSINVSATFSFPFHKIQTGGLVFMLIGVLAFLRHRQLQAKTTPTAAKGPVKMKKKTTQRAKATKVVVRTEPDIGEYKPCTSPLSCLIPIRILKWLAFIVILIGTTLGMYTQIQHFRSNTFFAWGSRFISQKYNNYNAARDYWFRRATELNPSNGRAEFFWGWATSKTQDYATGIKLLTHAQYLYPQTDTHYTLGLTYTWWGDKLRVEKNEVESNEKYELAIDALKTASHRLPTRLEYYQELVKLLNRTARFDEAAVYSKRAITVYKWVTMAQNVEYHFHLWLGQALIAQEKLDEAVDILQKATKLKYDKQALSKKAIKVVKAVSLEDQPQAYLLWGQALEKKGDLEEANEKYIIYMSKNNRLPQKNQANDISFFLGRLQEKWATYEPDWQDNHGYTHSDKAKDYYQQVVRIKNLFENHKEKLETDTLNAKQIEEFTSKYGRPVTDKMNEEALNGLDRIKVGDPYPLEDEVVLIESETVGIEEAKVLDEEKADIEEEQ